MGVINVGDMVEYRPNRMKFRIHGDDGGYHTGIVVGKVKYPFDRKINHEVLWDDCPRIYGYGREELKVIGRAGK